jgi:hypothetical protein
MDYAFTYFEDNSAELETDYPYKGVDGTCSATEDKGVCKVSSYVDVSQNEAALAKAVNERVVSVAVDA